MSTITLRGKPITTCGTLPAVGSKAPEFNLTATDMSDVTLATYAGTRLVLNIFPSIDTPICAMSTRTFNTMAAAIPNTKVLCISLDLPFAHKRFCTTEGIENVVSLSELHDRSFGESYGVRIVDGGMRGLFSRAIVVVDANGTVLYNEQVPEIAQEPDYEAALAVLK